MKSPKNISTMNRMQNDDIQKDSGVYAVCDKYNAGRKLLGDKSGKDGG